MKIRERIKWLFRESENPWLKKNGRRIALALFIFWLIIFAISMVRSYG